MRAKLILLTFLVFLFVGYVAVRILFLDQKEKFGRIKVVSSPRASVFLNTKAVGRTPYEAQVAVDEYVLKLIPEETATDTASWQGKIRIFKNTLTYVNRELGASDISSAGEIFTAVKMEKSPEKPDTGQIAVDTEPVGAIVYFDNEEKGVSSLILSDVPKGTHEVSVFMPGFFRRTQKVNIEPGYRVNAAFKLAIDPSQKREKKEKKKEATESAKIKKTYALILETPTGFLRVRTEPSVNAAESAQVAPGEKFEILEEQEQWYKIEYQKDKQGWVFSQYVNKVEE